jgi:hypothetical protein
MHVSICGRHVSLMAHRKLWKISKDIQKIPEVINGQV